MTPDDDLAQVEGSVRPLGLGAVEACGREPRAVRGTARLAAASTQQRDTLDALIFEWYHTFT